MSSPAEQQRERISLGLIEYLSRHTLDEDYAAVARRAPIASGSRSGAAWGPIVGALVVLAAFGLLVFTAASQTTRNSVSEADDRADLVGQVQQQKAALAARNAERARLLADNRALNEEFLNGTKAGATLSTRLRRLSERTGAIAVSGAGVQVVVDDAPDATTDKQRVLDSDLQKLVNGLWEAGAEAISINGQRLTMLSSIRQAGDAINVNYRPLSAPYTLQVLGNPRTLPSRFAETTHGATWFDLQRQVGLRFAITSEDRVRLPAAEPLTLRYATRAKGDQR